eukprot:10805012-Prorocentrum_lima.AAC.1
MRAPPGIARHPVIVTAPLIQLTAKGPEPLEKTPRTGEQPRQAPTRTDNASPGPSHGPKPNMGRKPLM